LRISSALALTALVAACGPEAGAPEGEAIECAIGPGAEFARDCVLEVAPDGVLVIHHPGGGFRRFVRKGEGLLPLDGADPLVVGAAFSHAYLEFTVAEDRYRVPTASDPRL
jgi:hypothetical protein